MKTYHLILFLLLFLSKTTDAQNPVLINDINQNNSLHADPNNFAIVNNKMVFAASLGVSNSAMTNRELMVSDGTPNGTQLLKDILPGNNSSEPKGMITLYNKTYFTIYDYNPLTGIYAYKVWVTDGTTNGTYELIAHPKAETVQTIAYDSKYVFIPYQGLVYFPSKDTVPPYDNVIYQTDGTKAGTKIAIRLPNNNAFVPNLIECPIVYADKLFFTGNTNAKGSSLYKYDTITKTPVLVKSNLKIYTLGNAIYNNKLYFVGAGDSASLFTAPEPWISDGTDTGTYQVKRLSPPLHLSGSNVRNFYVMKGKLFFTSIPSSLFVPGVNTVLYSIDSLIGDTTIIKVKDISKGQSLGIERHFYKTDSAFYFPGSDSLHGEEPWVSDGTVAGTKMVKDIILGSTGSQPKFFTAYCGNVYFSALGMAGNFVRTILYKTDGTVNNTSIIPGLSSNPSIPAGVLYDKIVYNNKLFFGADFPGNIGVELYTYDAQCNLVSVPKYTALTNITIFPNPSDGIIHIEKKNRLPVVLTVYDLTGKIVLTQSFSDEKRSINLAQQSKGFYYLKVQSDTDIKITKVNLQ
jgi:ELWxxDGT repeat protein